MTDVELTGAGRASVEVLLHPRHHTDEAPSEAEASRRFCAVGCVVGVQPDKWQRRWQENRPDVRTSWEFVDSAVQWEGLRTGRWSIVLVRTTVAPHCGGHRRDGGTVTPAAPFLWGGRSEFSR
ncbi:MAG: hypothetical protein U1U88_000539 [Lawsonella clevelandensis]